MKRSFKAIITLVLALTMIMSFSVAAYADGALPTETVRYGYNLPDAIAVPMHGLAAENITIDGIDIELYSADGYVYVRLVDLAAAKLLRESADKLAELGLTLDQLYIKDGLILVKADGLTEDEVAALTAKVAALTAEVQIAVSVGDKFTLGNAGVTVLQVEIGGFSMPPVEAPAPSEPDESSIVTKLNVDAGTKKTPSTGSPTVTVPEERPEVTTLYITYGVNEPNPSLQGDLYGTYKIMTTDKWDNTEQDVDYDLTSFGKAVNESVIYLVKAEDDETDYYYSTDGISYTKLNDSKDNKEQMAVILSKNDTNTQPTAEENEESSNTLNNTVIYISTTPDSSNVIKTIKYNDVTPTFDPEKPTDLPSDEEYNKSTNKVSTDYIPEESISIDSGSAGTPIDEAKTVTVNVNNGISVNNEFLEQETDNNTAPQNADASADAAQAGNENGNAAADTENTAGAADTAVTGDENA